MNENNNENIVNDEIAIKLEDVHKSYGNHEVLKGLNLEVKKGELFGFIGKNGVGKSTTIDCITGVKRFEKGTINLLDYDISKEAVIAKSHFGYVASEPICYENMTGYEYLEFVASVYKISEGEFVQNYQYLAKRLDLKEEQLNQYVSSYSHGMKQKLCLIASLLNALIKKGYKLTKTLITSKLALIVLPSLIIFFNFTTIILKISSFNRSTDNKFKLSYILSFISLTYISLVKNLFGIKYKALIP